MSEETQYANKVLFLRKSKKGDHLYAFQKDEILGGEFGSIVMNVSEVGALILDKVDWVKVTAMKKEERSENE